MFTCLVYSLAMHVSRQGCTWTHTYTHKWHACMTPDISLHTRELFYFETWWIFCLSKYAAQVVTTTALRVSFVIQYCSCALLWLHASGQPSFNGSVKVKDPRTFSVFEGRRNPSPLLSLKRKCHTQKTSILHWCFRMPRLNFDFQTPPLLPIPLPPRHSGKNSLKGPFRWKPAKLLIFAVACTARRETESY